MERAPHGESRQRDRDQHASQGETFVPLCACVIRKPSPQVSFCKIKLSKSRHRESIKTEMPVYPIEASRSFSQTLMCRLTSTRSPLGKPGAREWSMHMRESLERVSGLPPGVGTACPHRVNLSFRPKHWSSSRLGSELSLIFIGTSHK